MNGFVFVYLVLLLLGAAIHVVRHGQPREPYNGKEMLFWLPIILLLLWLGGLWS